MTLAVNQPSTTRPAPNRRLHRKQRTRHTSSDGRKNEYQWTKLTRMVSTDSAVSVPWGADRNVANGIAAFDFDDEVHVRIYDHVSGRPIFCSGSVPVYHTRRHVTRARLCYLHERDGLSSSLPKSRRLDRRGSGLIAGVRPRESPRIRSRGSAGILDHRSERSLHRSLSKSGAGSDRAVGFPSIRRLTWVVRENQTISPLAMPAATVKVIDLLP